MANAKQQYEHAVLQVLDDGVPRMMPSIERLASWKLSDVPFSDMEVRRAVWRLINRGLVCMDLKMRFSLV